LEELSEDLVCARPRLCLFYSWYYLAAGRLDDIEPYLIKAERAAEHASDGARKPEKDGDGDEIRGEVTTIRAVMAGLLNQPERAMDLSREATELLTEDNQFLRCMIVASRGFAHRGLGDVAAASEAFAEAAALARSVDATYVALLAYKQLVELRMVQGRLRAAADVCRRALDLVSESHGRLPASSAAHVGMGELLREWNELHAAEEHLLEGIELGEQGGNAEILLDGHLALARTRHALGDGTGATAAIEAARRLSERHDMDAWAARVRAWQARFAAAQGDRWDVERWLEECGLSTEDPDPRYEFEYVTLARVLMALGEHDEACKLLQSLLRLAEAGERGGRVVEILTLRALVLSARGRGPEAVGVLQRALALAEPEGYVRTFTDEGAPIVPLLEQARKVRRTSQRDAGSGASAQYISGLLVALGVDDASTAGSNPSGAGGLAEVVSEREVEVLRHLASGTANREIAERLFVSLDTVKTHLKHIYNKLGVHNRTQAIARARELDLIQDAPAQRAGDR
jgi:LuxR family maltose regulon positive regulatory protein